MLTKRQWAMLWYAACEIESREEVSSLRSETDWDESDLGPFPEAKEWRELARQCETNSFAV